MARWHSSALSGLIFWVVAACGGISGSTGKGLPEGDPSGGAPSSGGATSGGSGATSTGGAPGTGGRAGAGGVMTSTGGVMTSTGGVMTSTGGVMLGAGGVNIGAGGAPVPTCSPVSFSIRLEGFPAGAQVCDSAANSCSAISQAVTIQDASGKPLPSGGWCSVDCTLCSNTICPPVPCLPPTAHTTIETSWNGMQNIPGTCGSGKACYNRAICAPSGHYTAHLCGYVLPSAGSAPLPCNGAAATPTCVDVPFDYPTSQVVIGVLRP